MIENYKANIIGAYNELFHWLPLDQVIIEVFKRSNRHDFVSSFYSSATAEKTVVTEENINDFFPIIYKDEYLITKIAADGEILSSISQPSLVLYMLNIAKIKAGYQVLEIGTATGWNASLMSLLVGDDGEVDTIEIDNELASQASENLQRVGLNNVNVFNQDGALGLLGKKYDVIMFTVGTYDIHKNLYNQLKDGGRLILVLKNHGGGDTLFSFIYSNGSLISESGLPCGFVQIQGSHKLQELQPINVDTNDRLKELFDGHVTTLPFWFGGYKIGSFFWRTQAFRAFLSIVEPCYTTISFADANLSKEENVAFGVFNNDEFSIAVLHNENLKFAGSDWAKKQLEERLLDWVRSGMPTIASYKVEAMPKNDRRRKTRDEYVISRDESTFYFKPGV